MNKPFKESVKTTGRMGVVGAVAVIATYLINKFFPSTPEDVVVAVLFLLFVGVDRFSHVKGFKIKVPF